MSQVKRKHRSGKKGYTYVFSNIKEIDDKAAFFFSAIYILIAASTIAIYMIWHYFGYGQWAMDVELQSIVKGIRTPELDAFFRAITATGETTPVVIITTIIVLFLGISKKTKESILFACHMVATAGLNDLLKGLIHRPRPLISMHLAKAKGFSLPSGHSMNFLALVLFSLYLIWIFSKNKRVNISATILLLAYAFLLGISRIYLNVHYFSDVITGWSIGAACAAITIIVHRLICVELIIKKAEL